MKRILMSVLLCAALMGCATKPNTIAYQTIGSIIVSTSAARDAYFSYRDANPGKVSNDLDDKLKKAYADYQAALVLVQAAERIATTGGAPVDTTQVSAASASLISLVSQTVPNFTPK